MVPELECASESSGRPAKMQTVGPHLCGSAVVDLRALGEGRICHIDSSYSTQRDFQNTFFGLHTVGGQEGASRDYFPSPKGVFSVTEKTRPKTGKLNNPRDYEISA